MKYGVFGKILGALNHFPGTVKAGDKILMMQTGKVFDVTEVGIFIPSTKETK